MKQYRTLSFRATQAIGESIARHIKAQKSKKKIVGKDARKTAQPKHATVFALTGELGAGKTTFTQGFLKGFGIKKRAQSPTFIIMRRHGIRSRPHKNIYHVDAYRLKKAEQMKVLEFEKILDDPRNVILIEWPERIKEILPKHATWISFKHGKKENERIIAVRSGRKNY